MIVSGEPIFVNVKVWRRLGSRDPAKGKAEGGGLSFESIRKVCQRIEQMLRKQIWILGFWFLGFFYCLSSHSLNFPNPTNTKATTPTKPKARKKQLSAPNTAPPP